jgi:iron-sulfur cluster assembly protein
MIQLSPAAIAEIKRIQSKQPDTTFRLGVKPGGCAEFYYTMALDQETEGAIDCNGIPVTIAPQHQPYLNGVTLDYTEDLMGGGFRFHNPNVVSHCECGNSFTANPSAPAAPRSPDAPAHLAPAPGNP